MGTGPRLSSRIFTNSFAGKEKEMASPLKPNNYFGFQNKTQYSYNVYHQLANNGARFGSLGARWARINHVIIPFIPPNFNNDTRFGLRGIFGL
jgi:hypothetical protein